MSICLLHLLIASIQDQTDSTLRATNPPAATIPASVVVSSRMASIYVKTSPGAFRREAIAIR